MVADLKEVKDGLAKIESEIARGDVTEAEMPDAQATVEHLRDASSQMQDLISKARRQIEFLREHILQLEAQLPLRVKEAQDARDTVEEASTHLDQALAIDGGLRYALKPESAGA